MAAAVVVASTSPSGLMIQPEMFRVSTVRPVFRIADADTRRCTTHHELIDALRLLAPQAQVIGKRVFVVDGPLASSAGITAGIDIALHLIAGECGDALAASVA